MNHETDLDRLLEQTDVPHLRESAHREQLKSRLLEQTAAPQPIGDDRMRTNGSRSRTSLMKIAAAVLIASFLVATGWAAEKVYQKIIGKELVVVLEERELPAVKFPGEADGRGSSMSVVITATTSDDPSPEAAEKARARHETMKKLIGEKKYKLLRTFEDPSNGIEQYVYQFTFPDGEQTNMNFLLRLEEVDSWEDYQQKSDELARKRSEQISESIAAGRFRMLDARPLVTHKCVEVESGQKLRVLQINLPDGKQKAFVRGEKRDQQEYQTDWQDHLEAIRTGERTLDDIFIVKNYTYEITLQDGSTTIFSYGGDKRLEQPQE